MNILEKPKFEILNIMVDTELLEKAGRTCYNSFDRFSLSKNDNMKYLSKLIGLGHESVIEHQSLSVLFTCDRNLANQLVRHRLCSFSQESQRYVNYKKDGITVVKPDGLTKGTEEYNIWKQACETAETNYLALIDAGIKPEVARSVLPGCTQTHIVCTANLREWRHIMQMRCDKHAQSDIRHLMQDLLHSLIILNPEIFGDLKELEKDE